MQPKHTISKEEIKKYLGRPQTKDSRNHLLQGVRLGNLREGFEQADKKFIGTNFIYNLKLPGNETVPVLVHAHHSHFHDINDEFGVKHPINIDHLVCFL